MPATLKRFRLLIISQEAHELIRRLIDVEDTPPLDVSARLRLYLITDRGDSSSGGVEELQNARKQLIRHPLG